MYDKQTHTNTHKLTHSPILPLRTAPSIEARYRCRDRERWWERDTVCVCARARVCAPEREREKGRLNLTSREARYRCRVSTSVMHASPFPLSLHARLSLPPLSACTPLPPPLSVHLKHLVGPVTAEEEVGDGRMLRRAFGLHVRHADRQTERQTKRQKDRQTGRQTHMLRLPCRCTCVGRLGCILGLDQ